jgi:DNA-binding NtrC family response regulator
MSLPSSLPRRADESSVVLIASADPTAAALLGGLVETLGFTVRFARCDESPEARIRRARPRVYMIDCATTEDCNDEVIGRAMMRGVAVVLFGPHSLLRSMRELATRHELELVLAPVDPGPLGDVFDRAAHRAG